LSWFLEGAEATIGLVRPACAHPEIVKASLIDHWHLLMPDKVSSNYWSTWTNICWISGIRTSSIINFVRSPITFTICTRKSQSTSIFVIWAITGCNSCCIGRIKVLEAEAILSLCGVLFKLSECLFSTWRTGL
jgi:hypothetical protein